MKLQKLVLSLAAIAMLAGATSAFGCTVCFGETDHPIVKGAEASVLFMMFITYMTLGSGVVGFFLLRRRARRLAEANGTTTAPQPQTPFSQLANEQGAYRQ